MSRSGEPACLSPEEAAGAYAGATLDGEGGLVEMAGRDSVAAAVSLAKRGGLSCILPTIVFTGTEYGDIQALSSNVELLRGLLGTYDVGVLEPAALCSAQWWREVIGRPNSMLSRMYGAWHICLGCHMYLHAIRVPLALRIGTNKVITGERISHKGVIKINQSRTAVEAYSRALAEWGLRLEAPLLTVDEEAEIVGLTGEWEEGSRQPDCLFAGNYRDLEGRPICDGERVEAYLEEYLLPVTRRIIGGLVEEGAADYRAIVRQVLVGLGG